MITEIDILQYDDSEDPDAQHDSKTTAKEARAFMKRGCYQIFILAAVIFILILIVILWSTYVG